MIEAQIANGDYVVVKKQKTAQAGQIVVAITDDGDTTLKYWYPEKKRVRLQPANSTMDPIYCNNAQVEGIVVGVVRKVK
jgi:repressor LexA